MRIFQEVKEIADMSLALQMEAQKTDKAVDGDTCDTGIEPWLLGLVRKICLLCYYTCKFTTPSGKDKLYSEYQ